MPQYIIEYLEDGTVLKSDVVTAGNGLAAWVEAKNRFTNVQANLGARDFKVLDQAGAVLMRHDGPKQDDGNDNDRARSLFRECPT
jgi:hypothetical protein